MDSQLKNKIALVTGSTAGIGFAITLGLDDEGGSFLALKVDISTFADISPSVLSHRDSLAAEPSGNVN